MFWINFPPATNGIIQVFSPREIVTKRVVDYKLRYRDNFGQYVLAHVDLDVTNKMEGRTFARMYLGPTGNL